MEKIVVIGGGGHAKVLISILKKNARYEILGYTDVKDNGDILGVRYLGNDSILPNLVKNNDGCMAVLAVGSIQVENARKRIVEKLEQLKFNLPAIISKDAVINEGVVIGAGTVVCDGAIVNSGTVIGKYSIINTNSTIEHDCNIGDFVHIASGANISGGVQIGNNSMIGVGVSVIQSVRICENCMIGAGAVVVDNCLKAGTYWGVPAKIK